MMCALSVTGSFSSRKFCLRRGRPISGQAEQLGQLAIALNQIARKFEDINWVLQVEGHRRHSGPCRQIADNWDLSTERALSVVRFLADAGLPSNRLAAAGYGDSSRETASTDEARLRNRRIEMKLTQRITGTDSRRFTIMNPVPAFVNLRVVT